MIGRKNKKYRSVMTLMIMLSSLLKFKIHLTFTDLVCLKVDGFRSGVRRIFADFDLE